MQTPSQPVRSLRLLLFAIWLLAGACVSSPRTPPTPATLQRFEYERPQMGLSFRIVLYAPDQMSGDSAAAAAFGRIAELNGIMSDYEDDSELNRLARTSGQHQAVRVSPDLWRVLERAQDLAERSDGAFDVTVGPYVKLWRRARRERKLPEALRLAEAAQRVGYQHVRLDRKHQTVELRAPEMRLDLGGIAKGDAVDQALKVLRARGVTRALVAGAGDLAVWDPPPGETGWRIELAPLDTPQAPPARFVRLRRAALATSGDLFQRLEIDGRRYSHILDPRTGVGLTDHSLVTVIAPDCMTADSLTKVVSVLGPEKGLRFIERTRGVEARVVRLPADVIELRETSGFRRYFD